MFGLDAPEARYKLRGIGPGWTNTLKSPSPVCLTPGTKNGSEEGALASGTESPTGRAWAGNGGPGP